MLNTQFSSGETAAVLENKNGVSFFRFRSWTVGRRITVSFTSILFVVAMVGGLAWVKVRSLNERFDEVATNNVPSLELISRAQMAATQNRLLIYKQISSSDKADRQQLENQFAENGKIVTEALDQYDKLSVTAEERTIVAAIGTARGEYLKKCNEILEMNRNSADNTATYLQARSQLDPIASQYAAALQAASDHEIRSMGESSAEFQAAIASTKRGAALGVALAIMSGICISWSITRAIDRVLRRVSNSLAEGAGQVASSSQQVSAASQTLAEGSSEQAASLEETGSSLEEMGSMTRRNSESATKLHDPPQLGERDQGDRTRATDPAGR